MRNIAPPTCIDIILELTIRSTTTTMNANPRDKYNGGIKLACDNVTGQVGLSYLNGTVVVMAPFSYISDGYFGKNLQVDAPHMFIHLEFLLTMYYVLFSADASTRRQGRLLSPF